MQFDLFTFLASLFNFLVLMVLLRIFLFKRITNAMDEREKRISDTWEEAEDAREEAEQAREEYEQQRQEADEERESLVEAAREEADRERSKRLEALRSEIEEQRSAWLEDLKDDKDEITRRITEQAVRTTTEVVEQTLELLAGSSLADEIAATLSRKIRTDWAEELGELSEDLDVTVVSSHPLGDQAKEHVESALGEIVSPRSVSFEGDDSLICGIRLELADRELGFSAADQVRHIEQRLDSILRESAGA